MSVAIRTTFEVSFGQALEGDFWHRIHIVA